MPSSHINAYHCIHSRKVFKQLLVAFRLLLWQLYMRFEASNLSCTQAIVPAEAVNIKTILSLDLPWHLS